MLDNILDLVKGPVVEAITKSKEVPTEKKEQAINTTTSAIANTLQNSITPDNISQLTNLFTGGSKATTGSNFLTDGITSTIVNVLSSKIGISKVAATAVASAIVPTLMKTLTNKISGGKSGGLDVGSLIGMFTGDNTSSASTSTKSSPAGDVLGALGKLLKK